ncbi:sorting nexin-19-like [Lampris incognitus]|uniref:sorting nexin-19-like n=1 Tax=Lampris incognitus TaxID=2546036 RepID=UPI0024B482A5|nr:sorting nexin-19-like [Lampris incognitus]
MAEVLGQRSLLGFGILLAWLVLFHLLVNIWLLCVFTSLLVVLGGWLGSQAILESNSVVHLERFITLEQVLPSVEDEGQLDQEIQNTVKKIIRDFVSSWYSTVSSERGFEFEVQEAMISMAMELKKRARQVDRKVLTERALNLCGCHLQSYIRAKEFVAEQEGPALVKNRDERDRLWKVYSRISAPHPAMKSAALEVNYARTLIDLMLHVLVPPPHLESRTGRFVVGELITCNVLLPLIAKLSDPDWLNLLIVGMFTRSSEQQKSVTTEPSNLSPPSSPPLTQSELTAQQETEHRTPKDSEVPSCPIIVRAETEMHSHKEVVTPEPAVYDVMDSDELYYSQNSIEEDPPRPFFKQHLRPGKLNPFYRDTDSDLDSPLGDSKQSSMDSLIIIGQEDSLGDRRKEFVMPNENNNGVDLEAGEPEQENTSCVKIRLNSELLDQPDGCGTPTLRTAEGIPSCTNLQEKYGSSTPARELLLGVEQTGLGNHNELAIASPQQVTSPLPSFSFEPLSSPEGPVIIQNLRITGTITAKEHRGTGSHPYTLYTIKYETAIGCDNPACVLPGSENVEAVHTGCDSPASVQPVAYHMVNRRYSEFLNLQTRLEEKTELRKLLKGIKGPKKIFPDMPFGNMDSDKIEARKGMLETFLKQLCAIPETANSEEMQEFLALNTDARIAFVKKPFIVSRIDKIVVNAIVDTLKTAFPRSELQSPTEDNEGEIDGGKIMVDKKNKSRLRFSSKNSPFMNGSDVRPQVVFSCEQNNSIFNSMSLGDLEAFITGQERQISGLAVQDSEPWGEDGALVRESGAFDSPAIRSRGKQNLVPVSETALAEVLLNLLCLLLRNQWSWLCTENIQRTIRLLFGTLINRWLDVSVGNLMCIRNWVVYLQVLQEAVWPAGALPAYPRPERSQQQKDDTRQQALYCLMGLLPDLVSDMLGSEKHKLSWQTVLDSLQDPYINRHMVYCICDLLLEFLVPEISEEDFQCSLLQCLSKNPDKPLA